MTSNRFEQSGVSLVLDTTEYTRNVSRAISEAGKLDKTLDNLGGTVKVDLSVDDGRVDAAAAAINSLSQTEDVTINADTGKVAAAQTDIDALSQTEDVNITADTGNVDAALAQIGGQLQALQQLAVINILMEVPNIANSPVFSAVTDTESQVDRIAAMTGQEIPQAAGIINTLYSEAWGESRAEIADVIIELGRLGVAQKDYEAVARNAFQVAAVTGKEPLEVLTSMNKLVSNQLAGSFGEAGDFITKGFQEGFNRSDDFLDTINEYSPVLSDAGISIGGFFDILQSGLETGAFNTDKLIDGFKEMTNLSREEISRFSSFGEETDRTVAFGELGMVDEAQAYADGQLTGEQFSAGVLDALRGIDDPAKQRELALAIFSPTMVEDIGLPNLLAIDLKDSSELSDAWDGIAAEAATTLTDNLNGALAEFTRLIETELVTALDNAFDLTARLDTAKGQFQDFIAAIREGKTAGEAIEIAFGVEGVDTALLNIERVFGNLLIGILEAVAFIQDPTGTTDADARTRGEIARLAQGQLAFDLQVANIEEVPAILQQAVDRGVSGDAIGNSIVTAAQEAIARGDIEVAARLTRSLDVASQAPLTVMGRQFDAGTSPEDIKRFLGLSGPEVDAAIADAFAGRAEGITPQVAAELEIVGNAAREAFFTAMQEGNIGEALDIGAALDDPALISRASQAASEMFLAAQEALNNFDFGTANTLANQLEDPTLLAQVQELDDFLKSQFDLAIAEGDLLGAKQLATNLGDPELLAAVEGYKTNVKTSANDASNAMEISADDIRFALNREKSDMEAQKPLWKQWADAAILQIDLIAERILYVNEQMMGLNNNLAPGATGSGIGMGGGGMAEGGHLPANQLTWVGEEGPELFTTSRAGSIINAASSSMLMNALTSSFGSGGGTYITNNNYINMNTSNHMQNQAQADAYGYRAGKALRGFGG